MPDAKNLQPPRTNASVSPMEDKEDSSPSTYLKVDLEGEERTKLEGWVKDHFAAITQEMVSVQARFEDERDQLEGTIVATDYPYPGAFRITDPVTKKKCREGSNRIKQAYFDSDPIWAVTVSDMKGLYDYVQDVERSMSSMVDHDLEAEDDLSQAIFEGKLHGSGFITYTWEYQEDIVRNFESYEGFDRGLADRGMFDDSVSGIRKFEENYPDWKKSDSLKKVHKILMSGKKYSGEFSYEQPTRNLPALIHVPAKDVRAYPKTNGYSGLRTTPIYGYVQEYTLGDLKRLADSETIDEDQLKRLDPDYDEAGNDTVKSQMEPFEIFHATIRYQLPGDDIPVRYKIWYETSKNIILRIRTFPWWNPNPDLIPFYPRQEDPGFFKLGLAWDLVEAQVIGSLMYSMFFNAVDMANSMRWYVKWKSRAEQHLLSRRWSPHIPMTWVKDPKEAQSLMTPMNHIPALAQGIEMIRRSQDEETSSSFLQSGKESRQDPRAPAAKVAMLLKQIEPNTKEDIRSMEPAIRACGQAFLWLYYQGIALGWVKNMPGVPEIPHELLKEMAEKLQTRAMLFETDKSHELQGDMLVLKELKEIYGQSKPELIAQATKILVSGVSSKWAKLAQEMDFNIPPPVQKPPGAAGGVGAAGLPPQIQAMLAAKLKSQNGNGAGQPQTVEAGQ